MVLRRGRDQSAVNGPAVLVVGDGITDVADASAGRFGPDLRDVYRDWGLVLRWPHSPASYVDATAVALAFSRV